MESVTKKDQREVQRADGADTGNENFFINREWRSHLQAKPSGKMTRNHLNGIDVHQTSTIHTEEIARVEHRFEHIQ